MSEPPAAQLARFLEKRDLSALGSQPLVFERKPDFWKLLCCQALLRGVGSWGGFCAKQPLATFCPCTLAGRHSLEMDARELRLNSATNDCCWHVTAPNTRVVPLAQVAGASLADEDWTEACCGGARRLDIRTSTGEQHRAEFLADPSRAAQAISLAAQLARGARAPVQEGAMRRD